MLKILLCFSALCLLACQSSTTVTPDTSSPPPPIDSAQLVLKRWQRLVDANEFAAAKTLSTPATQQWLGMIEQLFQGDSLFQLEEPTDSLSQTSFLAVQCKILADTCFCDCLLAADGDTFSDHYRLLLSNNQWLVDIEEEETDFSEEDIEAIFEEMDEMMQSNETE